MKKLFAILAVAAVMTACNNAAEEKAAVVDSPKVESPVMDAVKTADSAANQMMNNVADTAKKVVEKVKDAVKH